MFAQTVLRDCHRSRDHSASVTAASSGVAREEPCGGNARHAARHPATISRLLVLLSASEPHRDVAIRAQLLARDARVSCTVLLTPHSARWQRFVERILALGTELSALGTDISARIVRASLPSDRTESETCTRANQIVRRAEASDLVLVGRRRTFPWTVAPLARYVRRLLRRTRTPVLIVGARPKGAYRNVVIATDFETDVGPALKWARQIAPHASFTFVHVYRGLLEGKLQWIGVPKGEIEEHRRAARREAARDMTVLLGRHRTAGVHRALLVHGWAVQDVSRKARELEADLIVVVRRTHSWWAEVLAASASAEIATRADRDVLVVHGASSSVVGQRSQPGRL